MDKLKPVLDFLRAADAAALAKLPPIALRQAYVVFESLNGLDTDIKLADFKKLLKVTGEIGIHIRSLSMLYGILDKKSCKSFTELLVGNAQRTALGRVLKDNEEEHLGELTNFAVNLMAKLAGAPHSLLLDNLASNAELSALGEAFKARSVTLKRLNNEPGFESLRWFSTDRPDFSKTVQNQLEFYITSMFPGFDWKAEYTKSVQRQVGATPVVANPPASDSGDKEAKNPVVPKLTSLKKLSAVTEFLNTATEVTVAKLQPGGKIQVALVATYLNNGKVHPMNSRAGTAVLAEVGAARIQRIMALADKMAHLITVAGNDDITGFGAGETQYIPAVIEMCLQAVVGDVAWPMRVKKENLTRLYGQVNELARRGKGVSAVTASSYLEAADCLRDLNKFVAVIQREISAEDRNNTEAVFLVNMTSKELSKLIGRAVTIEPAVLPHTSIFTALLAGKAVDTLQPDANTMVPGGCAWLRVAELATLDGNFSSLGLTRVKPKSSAILYADMVRKDNDYPVPAYIYTKKMDGLTRMPSAASIAGDKLESVWTKYSAVLDKLLPDAYYTTNDQVDPSTQSKKGSEPTTTQDTKLLFCYGSNGAAQLAERLGRKVTLTPAIMKNSSLVFAGSSTNWGGAVAAIEPKAGAFVIGSLVSVTDADLQTLDVYEGVPNVYRLYKSDEVFTVRREKRKVSAFYYNRFDVVSDTAVYGKPSDKYVKAIESHISNVWTAGELERYKEYLADVGTSENTKNTTNAVLQPSQVDSTDAEDAKPQEMKSTVSQDDGGKNSSSRVIATLAKLSQVLSKKSVVSNILLSFDDFYHTDLRHGYYSSVIQSLVNGTWGRNKTDIDTIHTILDILESDEPGLRYSVSEKVRSNFYVSPTQFDLGAQSNTSGLHQVTPEDVSLALDVVNSLKLSDKQGYSYYDAAYGDRFWYDPKKTLPPWEAVSLGLCSYLTSEGLLDVDVTQETVFRTNAVKVASGFGEDVVDVVKKIAVELAKATKLVASLEYLNSITDADLNKIGQIGNVRAWLKRKVNERKSLVNLVPLNYLVTALKQKKSSVPDSFGFDVPERALKVAEALKLSDEPGMLLRSVRESGIALAAAVAVINKSLPILNGLLNSGTSQWVFLYGADGAEAISKLLGRDVQAKPAVLKGKSAKYVGRSPKYLSGVLSVSDTPERAMVVGVVVRLALDELKSVREIDGLPINEYRVVQDTAVTVGWADESVSVIYYQMLDTTESVPSKKYQDAVKKSLYANWDKARLKVYQKNA